MIELRDDIVGVFELRVYLEIHGHKDLVKECLGLYTHPDRRIIGGPILL